MNAASLAADAVEKVQTDITKDLTKSEIKKELLQTHCFETTPEITQSPPLIFLAAFNKFTEEFMLQRHSSFAIEKGRKRGNRKNTEVEKNMVEN